MLPRPVRLVLLIGGLAAVLLVALATGGYLYLHGPGFDREVNRLADLVELRPGMTVADIGAGQGRMAVRLARRTGPAGVVYATELEPDLLEAIRRAAAQAGLSNVRVLPAAESSANLPESCCDAICLRRVYHHLGDAASMNRSFYAALRPGGRLAVIDFLSPRWLPIERHGIAAATVFEQVVAAGFVPERRIDLWSPLDYCLIFRKPEGRNRD